MDKLMNRCRAFAGGVVAMVCPVLLALALKKVDLKSEEHGPAFPIVMLVIAGVTLLSGICPVLACCFSEIFATAGVIPPPVTWSTWSLTLSSSTCLVVLACLIAVLIISKSIVISIGIMFGVCIFIRTFFYCCARCKSEPVQNDDARRLGISPKAQEEAEEEFYSKLDNSLEFLSGVTGILFLGLEGLALGGQISSSQGIQHPMVISFVACALGVFLMFLEMIPPLLFTTTNIALFTVLFDAVMATGAVVVLVVIMLKLMGYQALLLLTPAFLIFLVLVFRTCAGGSNDDVDDDGVQKSKPAPLELTKVTFTGFLAVSVATISSGSPNKWTDWFLLFAAGAIVSGLAWRLLTHAKSKTTVETAIVASFFTHFCVAIATILFAVMAGKALS